MVLSPLSQCTGSFHTFNSNNVLTKPRIKLLSVALCFVRYNRSTNQEVMADFPLTRFILCLTGSASNAVFTWLRRVVLTGLSPLSGHSPLGLCVRTQVTDSTAIFSISSVWRQKVSIAAMSLCCSDPSPAVPLAHKVLLHGPKFSLDRKSNTNGICASALHRQHGSHDIEFTSGSLMLLLLLLLLLRRLLLLLLPLLLLLRFAGGC